MVRSQRHEQRKKRGPRTSKWHRREKLLAGRKIKHCKQSNFFTVSGNNGNSSCMGLTLKCVTNPQQHSKNWSRKGSSLRHGGLTGLPLSSCLNPQDTALLAGPDTSPSAHLTQYWGSQESKGELGVQKDSLPELQWVTVTVRR